MPYRDTYGFPPYDPEKPGGGWDAETWQRYRQQQRERSYPGQFKSKTDRLASNKYRSDKKKNAAIAKIDATLARNTLGAPPKDEQLPGGLKSRAQILYARKAERRARLQAQRDRLQAELQRAPARPFSDKAYPDADNQRAIARARGETVLPATTTPAPTTTTGIGQPVGQSGYKAPPAAYTNKGAPANLPNNYSAASPTNGTPGQVAAAVMRSQTTSPTYTGANKARTVAELPGQKLPTAKGAPKQPAYSPTANTQPKAQPKAKAAPLPAAGRADWATEAKRKGVDPYVIQQQKGGNAKQAKRVMGYTPASGKSKDESAPAPKKKK